MSRWRQCWPAIWLFDWSDRKRAAAADVFLILSTVLLLMTARWKRFGGIFSAVRRPVRRVHAGAILAWPGGFTHLPDDVMEDLQPFLDRQTPDRDGQRDAARRDLEIVKAAFVALCWAWRLFANVYRTAKDISDS